ncbi:MAG TPA: hypothetical protein VGQ57_00790, partial [Polyangiaceae bacterium]|nr:hypothetical protein [Polyangiaceae bacterium]
MSKLPTLSVDANLLARFARRSFRPLSQRIVLWVTVAVVALGVFVRARGYLFDTHALWLDEAGWALMLMRLPLVELLIRPPGFMAFSKGLAHLFGPTEAVLRFLPWLAGTATVVVTVPLSRRLFGSLAARLLFVAVIALHPAAVDLAREYKPYALS